MLDEIVIIVCRILSSVADREIKPDDTLAETGLDSMDLIEVMLDLEEAFPEVDLDDYLPEDDTTAREIAIKIDWMKVGK